ncbi:RNA-binding protein 42-like [Antedon mediterranea]|uniref:RNA-binding protein 42-like n=1 Tax=Antedon mediterranea TaxID=105859 RepID=UPI003AF70842
MDNNYCDTGQNQMFAMDKMKEMEEEMNRFEEELDQESVDDGVVANNQHQDGCLQPPFPGFSPTPASNHNTGQPDSFPVPTGFQPRQIPRMSGPPGVRMGGPPGMRMGGPPGMRMGGPPGMRMGGPPGVASGPRQMNFIPHQLHRGPAPHLMPPGVGRMPMHMKPKTISAAPTVYSAKPVKFNTADKKEEKNKETPSVAEKTTGPPQPTQPQPQPPVNTSIMFQQAMMQQQMHQHHMQQPSTQEAAAPSRKAKKKKFVRTAAGQNWEDESLQEWDSSDFRIFCGDLGNEVNDDTLAKAFNRYPSFLKAKVVRDKRNGKTKGYGFVSFKDPNDFVQAMREMNGKYVGNRPIKLRKSMWKERNLENSKKKMREKQKLGLR